MDPSKENKDMFNSFFFNCLCSQKRRRTGSICLVNNFFFLKNMNNIKIIKFKEQERFLENIKIIYIF